MRVTRATLATLGCCLLAGCVSPYQTTGHPTVQLERMRAPVTTLAWADEEDQLLGLTEDDRLVKIDRRSGDTLDELRLPSVGENVGVVSYPTELAYVAVPGQDRVAVVETASMRRHHTLPGGPSPSWVAAHPTSHTLLVLSTDGATVTGVDLETHAVTLRRRVDGPPDAEIAEAEDSRTPAFWVVATGTASHFGGRPLERTRFRDPALEPDRFSPNRDDAGTAYASLGDLSRVAALSVLDGGPVVTAEREVGGSIEHIESKAREEFRVFLAGDGRLSVLDSDSLEVLATVEYDTVLDAAGLEGARVGSVVVGDLYVYLPVEDEPYLLRIHKPSE